MKLDDVESIAATHPSHLGHPHRWRIMWVVMALQCMELLDSTIVNIALPTIRHELKAGTASVQWIAGGYALAIAAGLLPAARLGDVYGRRLLFLMGTLGFTVASLACGLAPSTGALVGFRVVQGLSAALAAAQTLPIIREAFPRDELPQAIAALGPVANLSALIGPMFGGLLVDADLLGTGWRLIFLVNIPIGALTLWAGWRRLPDSCATVRPSLDVAGSLLAAAAMGLMIFPLVQGREHHWAPWTFALMGVSALLAALLVCRARRSERAGGYPVVPLSMLRKRAVGVGLLVAMLVTIAWLGLNLTLTLYLQLGLGFSATHAGLSLAPWAIGGAAGTLLAGSVLAPRLGRRALHVGGLIGLAGMAGLLAVVSADGAQITTAALALPAFACGLGSGIIGPPLITTILAAIEDRESGAASGVMNASGQLAAAIGVAVLGTVFFTTAASHGFARGLEHVVWVVIALLVATGALVFALPRTPDAERHQHGADRARG